MKSLPDIKRDNARAAKASTLAPAVTVRLPKKLLKRIDHFGIEHAPGRGRAAAVRILVTFALEELELRGINMGVDRG